MNSHVEEDGWGEFTRTPLAQVIQQVSMRHILRHYVVRRLPSADACAEEERPKWGLIIVITGEAEASEPMMVKQALDGIP